ncbi:four helix bundle protein [Flavisolibacter ginsengisoli]|jgi:four helix bundle protein|uniref:Four helix bundle protein n=1 Tax=Flavisolibacter ginsengisoli DSM 18119 TaxID=1121884 RepID=A0A1M5EFS9_9BACT|nr:four helix bundle protein [Flavisolibacter ginsengisoli]SHF78088.1 four helix bundle protein [Flavisolibacter ginsengisoli DSM 18119]
MSYQNFEDLEVWKKARALKIDIRKLTLTFPPEEKFRLCDQLVRSSRSVNSQLAEGHGRRTYPDRLRFCIIARGSLSETLNHLIDALDENYITETVLNEYKAKIAEVEKLLNGYIHYIEKKIDP